MAFASIFRMENLGRLAAFTFYAVVGVICFVVLAIGDSRLIHVGVIGILNLITAYGLLKKRIWVVWTIIVLFFITTVFSSFTLYYSFERDLFLNLIMIVYLVLGWLFTAYTATKARVSTS